MNAFLLIALLAQAPVAPEPVRADVHVAAGWQNLHKDQGQDTYNHWLNGIFYGGIGAGLYWTDHLKTQVDVGAGTSARQYRYRQVTTGNISTFETSRVEINEQSVSIGQQYQFFRNEWFHPRLGLGVELARETTHTLYDPIQVIDNTLHIARVVAPARSGTEHRFIARPFAEAGFKSYMTRRAFFTADARVMVRGGIDEVLFRAGFGVDF
jgi:hypothetical protein